MTFVLTTGLVTPVFAADESLKDVSKPHSTVLPDTDLTVTQCEKVMLYVNMNVKKVEPVKSDVPTTPTEETTLQEGGGSERIDKLIAKRKDKIKIPLLDDREVSYLEILSCAIKTGDVKVWMIPFFIRYILEFILGIAGLIAVGGIIYGGYLYLFAGLGDDKDKGKNAIKNGLIGLVLILTAWAIVNLVIILVTL
jgi:hypothetical protein